jgi:fatty-acyl-CoA synthase
VWIGLLRHPEFDKRDLPSLRKAYATAPRRCRSRLLLELSRRLPDVRFFNFYGQTEMSPMATLLGP